MMAQEVEKRKDQSIKEAEAVSNSYIDIAYLKLSVAQPARGIAADPDKLRHKML